MKRVLVSAILLSLISLLPAHAADEGDILIAGPIVRMVTATIGTVVSVKEGSEGQDNGSAVEIKEESGETRIFPIDATVKILDSTLSAITLSDIREGQKVAVEQVDTGNGPEKVDTIKVVK